MPITRGSDTKGAYYRWGPAGHGGAKHHYAAGNKASRERAKAKAFLQAKAIEASQRCGGAAPNKRKAKAIEASKRCGGAAPNNRKAAVAKQPKKKKMATGGAAKRKPAAKTGGKTPRKPKKKTISSAARAKQKAGDKSRVAETAAYRRAAASRK